MSLNHCSPSNFIEGEQFANNDQLIIAALEKAAARLAITRLNRRLLVHRCNPFVRLEVRARTVEMGLTKSRTHPT